MWPVLPVVLAFLLPADTVSGEMTDIRIFKNANLTFRMELHTSTCASAGTDSNVKVTVGFVHPKTSKLLYMVETPRRNGQQSGAFESGTVYTIEQAVSHEEFLKIEKICTLLGDFENQDDYEDCFRPNLLYFQLDDWLLNFSPAWKPTESYVKSILRVPGREHAKISTFRNGDCGFDWVKGGGDSYWCRDRPNQKGTYTYLLSSNGISLGKNFQCYKSDMRGLSPPIRKSSAGIMFA